jgi:hypothetical protein
VLIKSYYNRLLLLGFRIERVKKMEQYNWVLLDNWLEKHGSLGDDDQIADTVSAGTPQESEPNVRQSLFSLRASSNGIKKTSSKRA